MIYDLVENFEKYSSIHPHFADVAKFLKTNRLKEIGEGKHLVNNNGAFVIISTYESKPIENCITEAHLKYIDIQIPISGLESIGVASKVECEQLDFLEEKDFIKLKGEVSVLRLSPKHFAILFPDDAHTPQICYNNKPEIIKKAVFKIPVL